MNFTDDDAHQGPLDDDSSMGTCEMIMRGTSGGSRVRVFTSVTSFLLFVSMFWLMRRLSRNYESQYRNEQRAMRRLIHAKDRGGAIN